MNPSRLVETRRAKIVDGVIRERLCCEDARIVDDMVDRAEPGDRRLSDFLSRRCLTDVSVDRDARLDEGAKPALEMLREVATTL